MTAEEELSREWGRIQEERYRDQYKRSLTILRTIPNGTSDKDLTDEQRQAWRDHDESLAWLEENR